MEKPLYEIARLIGGEIVGDKNVVIRGVSGIKEAKPGEITFIADSRYVDMLDMTDASAVIVSTELSGNGKKPLVRCANPYLAFINLVNLWAADEIRHPTGIHPTAVIGENVKIGVNVGIHAYVVIDDNAVIGDNVIIYPHTYMGRESRIGNGTLIYHAVTIRERVEVGERCIIHSGTRIGSDGFGFASDNGVHHKVPQVGVVVIEDDVEIGANVTIDRATFGVTRIGKGTKIDNLVQIGHNVTVGENCIIVAQVGVAGSTEIGRGVTLAGQTGICGHIKIGDNSVVGARSGVTKSVPPNSRVSGFPAGPHDKEQKIRAAIRSLPDLLKRLHVLEKRVSSLETERDGTTEDDR
jgi:UDP-3-O-[3-hydroxymyristoyl] glucosamine N-acyltransferase